MANHQPSAIHHHSNLMRIAFDIRTMIGSAPAGGVRRYCEGLLREWARESRGHHFDFWWVAWDRTYAPRLSSWLWQAAQGQFGERVVRFPSRFFESPGVARALVSAPRGLALADRLTGGVDLFHTPAGFLLRGRRTRTVITIHDVAPVFWPEWMPRRELRRFLTVLRSAREADAIIADSEATRRDLIERLGFPEDRVHLIYLGVGAEFAPVEDEEVLARMRVELRLGPRPYFLMLSSIGPRKNLVRVLEAFESLVPRSDFEHTLVVAGANPWNYEDLAARLRESPARERMVETGLLPEMLLPALISASDALVFPSLYEGFGLPALEAMACGRPVLGSTAASLPEVVGPAGLLVDPYSVEEIREAMLTLAQDEALRQRLGQLGRERARMFTWARTAAQTLDVYEAIGP